MSLTITPFEERHLEAAARLLAQRHARDRAAKPALPDTFESPDAVRPDIERSFQQTGANGVVAERDGELAGYLLASPMLPAPRHVFAQFFPPRSMVLPYHGHALAPDEDASLHRDLYGALAEGWVQRGFFDHFINVPEGDGATREAWDSLGFARELTAVLRDTAQPVEVSASSKVEVHQAGPEDIEIIEALNESLWQHHTISPIFAPHIQETQESRHEMTMRLLADPANAHFVAYRDGAPLGMLTFMAQGLFSPMLTPDACVYLFQGIVYPQTRGGGVGRALLSHAMDWAREQDHRWCALHFYAANISGASFWQENGFRPVEQRLHRRIDERIAWARG